MRRFISMALLVVLLVLLITVSVFVSDDNVLITANIHIPPANLTAEVYSSPTSQCDCCPELWNGGLATVKADMSAVKVDDMAYLYLLGGERLVMECVAITPCVKLGGWLISWPSVLRVDGDVLIYSNGLVYRFVHL